MLHYLFGINNDTPDKKDITMGNPKTIKKVKHDTRVPKKSDEVNKPHETEKPDFVDTDTIKDETVKTEKTVEAAKEELNAEFAKKD